MATGTDPDPEALEEFKLGSALLCRALWHARSGYLQRTGRISKPQKERLGIAAWELDPIRTEDQVLALFDVAETLADNARPQFDGVSSRQFYDWDQAFSRDFGA
ncbi:MAG: hypothetical protein AAF196_06160 [Planctomycetota bacterium]